MAQTVVQHSDAIRFGSAKWEMGPNVGALVDVGAIRGGVFEYSFDKIEVKSDNAGVIKDGVINERAALGGDLMEINVENLASFYSGILSGSTVAAAPVAVTDEEQVLTGTAWNRLTNRNGDGTEVASIVVTNTAGTTTFVRDCDYLIGVDPEGYTVICRAYPAAIATAQVDIDAANGDSSYNEGSSGFATILAPGDHIYVSGFANAANNGVKTVVSATNAKIVVAEAVTTEATGPSITITRGGITSAQTVEVDYSYTPNASRTLKGGGLTTFTARVCRFTNTNAAGKKFEITVFSATPEGGITMNFPADDAEDPMLCPIKMIGTCDTTLTAGEQLFQIVDEQNP